MFPTTFIVKQKEPCKNRHLAVTSCAAALTSMAPCLRAGAPPLHIIHCKTRDMPELSPQEDGTAMILSDGLTTPHQEWDNVGGLPTNNLYYPPGHKLYCSLEISIIHIPTAIHPGNF